MKNIRRLGLELLLATSAAIAITIPITNIKAYDDTRDRLTKYGTVEKAIEAHEKELARGFPYDQIHDVFFGIGEKIAYRIH